MLIIIIIIIWALCIVGYTHIELISSHRLLSLK